MADGTTIADPPAPPPGKLSPAQTVLQSQRAIQDIVGKETAMAENLQKEDTEREARESSAISELEKQRGGLNPPQIEVPKQPEVKQTDPIKQWSSVAMMFAAIGSLFTRRPLTTAINAASAVLDAYRKNDVETANAAYKQWQDSFNNYMKVQQFELEEYKSALGDIQNREQLVMDIGKQESQDRIAEVNALGHAFGNQLMAQVHTEDDAWKAIESYQRMQETMAMQVPRIAIMKAQAQAIKKLQDSPEYKNASAAKQYALLRGQEGWVGLNEEQQTAYVRGTETRLTRQGTPVGDYLAVFRNIGPVEAVADKVRAGISLGVVDQTALADAYTQIINGGRAIRGFQMQMLQQHPGMWNRMEIEWQQWFSKGGVGKGGPLSPQMIDDMITISRELATQRRNIAAVVMVNAQDEAMENGVDPARAKAMRADVFANNDPFLEKMRLTMQSLLKNQDKPEYVQAFEKRFGVGTRFAVMGELPEGEVAEAPQPGQ